MSVDVGYRFYFDKAKDTWVCSKHGEVDSTAWVPCWNGCNEGWFEISRCSECKGNGGWRVCGECNADMSELELLERITVALERIASVIDTERGIVKISDVDRAKVYSTHLGSKLREGDKQE